MYMYVHLKKDVKNVKKKRKKKCFFFIRSQLVGKIVP